MSPLAGLLAFPLALALLAPAPAPADQPAAADGPRVRLAAPGRAPLRTLRYRAREGQKGRVTMSIAMSMEISLGAQALPSTAVPEMRYGMEYHVTKVGPEGDIAYEFSLNDPEVVAGPGVTPAVLEAVRASLEKLRGVRGNALLTSRGLVREADVLVPEGADAQLRQLLDGMRQSFRQLAAPFPEEPVGLGAKWETALRLSQNGITLDQTSTSELASLQGDSGRLAITLTQNAEPQQVQSPGMPAGTRMDLASLTSTGEGETIFDLGQLVPTRAQVKLHSEMKATMKIGQDQQPMGMKMDMSMTMTGK